jgi:predicted enzyme related to lactoylglutathione lyase
MAGEVVHLEFPSEDADRAAGFWNGLFGWEFGESVMPEMVYRMAKVSETLGAAIFPAEERTGHPVMYLDTGDIEASIEKTRELGGTAEEKSPVPGHGWFAACKDTEGNAFHLWQSDESAAPPAE